MWSACLIVGRVQPLPFHCVYCTADGYSVPLAALEIIPSDCRKEESMKGKKYGARYWNTREVRHRNSMRGRFLPISSSVILPPIGVGKLTMSVTRSEELKTRNQKRGVEAFI